MILFSLLLCHTKPESSEIINIVIIHVAVLKFLCIIYKTLTYRFYASTANSCQKTPFDSRKALTQ